MLLTEFNCHAISDTGLPSDQYKRAVLREPPSRFAVEFLDPSLSSGSYNYGMRITPIIDDSVSVISRGRQSEYEIWRRWEDCLWFQQTLASEYAQAAREKKTRLQQGKGVKSFNGMYKQDMAASWESLPPGPDPNSVAQDIFGYLPKLPKKGTLFRASQSTIESRLRDFRLLVETLFSEHMPSLVQEIRASPVVTDFFGFWRRDYDLVENSKTSHRNSMAISVFSSYFAASTPSLLGKSPPPSTTSPRKRVSSGSSTTPSILSNVSSSRTSSRTYRASSVGSTETTTDHRRLRRPSSVTSSDSSSIHSDGSSETCSTSSSNPAIVAEGSIKFGHNPDANERPSSILEILPEEREMLSKSDGYLAPPVPRKAKASPVDRKANRGFSIVGHPQDKPDEDIPPRSTVRESWQTTSTIGAAANDLLEGLDFSLPHNIKEGKFRTSIASVSTFLTTNSSDAVVPFSKRVSGKSQLRISTPLSLSDFDIYSDVDDDELTDCTSIFDAFPRPSSYLPGREHGSTPTAAYDTESSSAPSTPTTPNSKRSSFDRPPSPCSSTAPSTAPSTTVSVSTTSSSVLPDMISIKATFNSSIILLRVPQETPFPEIRQRIYNKFVAQEGIPLSKSFDIIFAPLSPGSERFSITSLSSMDFDFVHSNEEWQEVLSTTKGKVNLRILDSC